MKRKITSNHIFLDGLTVIYMKAYVEILSISLLLDDMSLLD